MGLPEVNCCNEDRAAMLVVQLLICGFMEQLRPNGDPSSYLSSYGETERISASRRPGDLGSGMCLGTTLPNAQDDIQERYSLPRTCV